MLDTALKLSDSRLLLFGALSVDTVCMGTLAVLLAAPTTSLIQQPSSLLLVSLAITGPVLALAVGGCALLIPKNFISEERARRAILAGTVLHLAAQGNAAVALLTNCKCRATSLNAYVLETALTVLAMLTLMVPVALWLRWRANRPNPLRTDLPPAGSRL